MTRTQPHWHSVVVMALQMVTSTVQYCALHCSLLCWGYALQADYDKQRGSHVVSGCTAMQCSVRHLCSCLAELVAKRLHN
jgi:hypothetical protein